MVSGASCTVSVALPVTPLLVAEIVVLPGVSAVTSPVLLTLATEEFDEFHVTWDERSSELRLA